MESPLGRPLNFSLLSGFPIRYRIGGGRLSSISGYFANILVSKKNLTKQTVKAILFPFMGDDVYEVIITGIYGAKMSDTDPFRRRSDFLFPVLRA